MSGWFIAAIAALAVSLIFLVLGLVKRPRWRNLKIGLLYLIVAPLLAFAGVIFPAMKSDGLKDACPGTFESTFYAKRAVENALKSPSTAEFVRVTSARTGDCTYDILGEVDAQNSFGAQIRNAFLVRLSYLPDAKKWSVDDLQFSGG